MVSPIELFSNEETFQETTQKKEGIRKQSEGWEQRLQDVLKWKAPTNYR